MCRFRVQQVPVPPDGGAGRPTNAGTGEPARAQHGQHTAPAERAGLAEGQTEGAGRAGEMSSSLVTGW